MCHDNLIICDVNLPIAPMKPSKQAGLGLGYFFVCIPGVLVSVTGVVKILITVAKDSGRAAASTKFNAHNVPFPVGSVAAGTWELFYSFQWLSFRTALCSCAASGAGMVGSKTIKRFLLRRSSRALPGFGVITVLNAICLRA